MPPFAKTPTISHLEAVIQIKKTIIQIKKTTKI